MPDPSTVRWPAVGTTALALLAMFRLHASMPAVLLGGAALGLLVVWRP